MRTFLLILTLITSASSLIAQRQFEIVELRIRMHELDNNAPLDYGQVIDLATFSELLAGEVRIGTFLPEVILRCVSASPLDTARIRFRMVNRTNGKIVYNTSKKINLSALKDTTISGIALCDIFGNSIGVPSRNFAVAPGELVRVTYPSFDPAPFIDDDVGSLEANVYPQCYPTDDLGICNPTDQDTAAHRFFKIRRVPEFHWTTGQSAGHNTIIGTQQSVPSRLMFVTFGATVIPDPYRFGAHRKEFSAIGSGDTISCPVICLDRLDENGEEYQASTSGDTLTTFPINLDGLEQASLVVCARGEYPSNAGHRRWVEDSLFGPEPRALLNSTEYPGDSLIIEMLRPSPDQLNGIVNTKQSDWIDQPLLRQALKLDRAAMPSASQVFSIAIPDAILSAVNEGARNFRFRVTLRARDNGPMDDADPWLIDEVHIYKDVDRDVSLQDVNIALSYSVLAHRQAAETPVEVFVANRTQNVHRNVRVRVHAQSLSMPSRIVTVERTVDSLSSLQQLLIAMPTMNLNAVANPATFNSLTADTVIFTATITSDDRVVHVDSIYRDDFPYNDTIIRRVPVRIGRALAYDAYEDEGHNVVANEAGIFAGFGLRTKGSHSNDDAAWARYGGTPANESEAGSIFMRFHLATADTLYGYQFAFDRTTVSVAPAMAELLRVEEDGSITRPGHKSITFYPGMSDVPTLDTMSTYLLPSDPIPLEPGTYLLKLSQLSTEPLNLCATAARAGVFVPSAQTEPQAGRATIASPVFHTSDTSGFPFYTQFDEAMRLPFVGYEGYSQYTYGDYSGMRAGTPTFRRGTWIPVMRVVLGQPPPYVPTSVDAADAAPSITIAPNPAREYLRVASNVQSAFNTAHAGHAIGTTNALSVELISLTGEVVGKGHGQGALTLDVSSLAAGIYVVRVTSGSAVVGAASTRQTSSHLVVVR